MYPLPLISFLFFATASLPPDGNLSGCNESSSCGSITNIDFPFTGGRRPHYCGLPGFNQLTCLENSTALLTTNFLLYRVLHIDQSRPTMTLSRSDLQDTADCTRNVQNTTLSSSNFTVAANTENLTLFYNCNDTSLSDVSSMLRSRCNTSFTVPISDVYSGVVANGSLLGTALGFEVNCADSGNAICICGNRHCEGSNRIVSLGTEYDNEKENLYADKDSPVPIFDVNEIFAATENFSLDNKLGQGGFGSVYKGLLLDEREVAVKRLSQTSRQGVQEFKNEVRLVSKLQHKNIARLFGCCIHGSEKMLVYEYLPNKSLDYFIFDKTKGLLLDWKIRFDIIIGIARGLLYLHQDSRLKIIHRDLKPSNVLLDGAMTPKISDFGMARLFGEDQMQGNTIRVVGTYGYMSPEYAMNGVYSTKSDVFSFGVLTLEIVSGMRSNDIYQKSPSFSLIDHVWELWRKGRASDIVDSSIMSEQLSEDQVLRCIHIGFLCVQESSADRPSMSDVVFMLSNATHLQSPRKPSFIIQSKYNDSNSQVAARAIIHSNNRVSITTMEAR